jgi:dihydrofolate reductase
MSNVRLDLSISLDGYVAGPNQSEEDPLGEGGEELHDWMTRTAAWNETHGRKGGEVNENTAVIEERDAGIGAVVMGRKMFGPIGGGPWDDQWRGWWGDTPPFGCPVFVVTHHEREPIEMKGGTVYHFVTDGIEAALDRAREAAGDDDVLIAGGASIANQYLNAGLIDEFEVHVAPRLLGDGERLFEGVGPDLQVEPTRVVEGPGVTHLKYGVRK